MTKLNVSHITTRSVVDGEGERTVLYLQGCSIQCKGCQNPQLWSTDQNKFLYPKSIADVLAHHKKPVTIQGGEPFDQPQGLLELLYWLDKKKVSHITVYSGYTWESLLSLTHPAYPYMKEITQYIDVLVDGPFIQSKDHDKIMWRGSTNQRPIDVNESLFHGYPVMLDWDTPSIIIDESGNAFLPIGLIGDLDLEDEAKETRRCGETE